MGLTSSYAEFMANPQLSQRMFAPRHGHDLEDLRAFTEAYKKDYFGGRVQVDTYPDRVNIRKIGMTNTPSLQKGEDRAAEVAKTPWRVNLEAMKKRVVSVEYIYPTSIPHMTICVAILDNGYALQGMSAPADPNNFDEKLGQEFAYEDALKKLWSLEAYVMRDFISGHVKVKDPDARWNPA